MKPSIHPKRQTAEHSALHRPFQSTGNALSGSVGRLFAVMAIVAMVVVGCSSQPNGEAMVCDPTFALGASQWVVEGHVVDQGGTKNLRLLDIRVQDVLWTRDVYYWIGVKYDTPRLESGSVLTVDLPEPSTRTSLTDQTLVFVLQAAGTPDELAAGTGVNGEVVYSIRLVLDKNWNLVEARNYTLGAYQEVFDMYPGSGLGRLVALLDDAWPAYASSNESFIAVGGSEASTQAIEVQTSGPLGEWRRAQGCESARIAQTSSDDLAAWMAAAPEQRQLPDVVEDLPAGAEAALGVTLEARQVAVNVDDEFRSRYKWVGLRIPGVGVIGPYFVEGSEPIGITGLLPSTRTIEIVGWTGDTVDNLADADVLGTVPSNTWTLGEDLWIEIHGTSDSGFDLQATPMSDSDMQRRLVDTLTGGG